MTIFLRLLAEDDKAAALAESCARVRQGDEESRALRLEPEAFDAVPGKPFAYWVSNAVRELFTSVPRFESCKRLVRQGGVTGNDERFLRLYWEVSSKHQLRENWYWKTFAKGGAVSQWYSDFPVSAIWDSSRGTFGGYTGLLHRPSEKPSSAEHYFKGGLTWPLRASRFAPVPLPEDCIFSIRGYAILAPTPDLMPIAALCNSNAFDYIFKVALGRFGFPEFVVGVLQNLPFPAMDESKSSKLSDLMKHAWSLKRSLDTVTETSHAFLLPLVLRQAQAERLCTFDPPAIEAELARVQAEIDDIAFDLYGFSDADRAAALGGTGGEASDGDADDADTDGDEDGAADDTPSADALLSWAIGVAFGRFDLRLATGERIASTEPEPFDPLPAKSPGMLPDGDTPFHAHPGILVENSGHAHDLVRIIERVLECVDQPVPAELRRWLQKDFFPFHLQRYSKSRRKAPIYWPLSTTSGSYTLWVYYPSLSSQTLYTAINDFVEPKLAEVESEAATLRIKGSARSRDEEKRLEDLATLEAELRDLREQLLVIAPQYKPNHDDGVQITAAPLWPLFRHKPWQKVLKDTWAKLEKGDYDWAHLAMSYWPERVREKCKHDKSLAIAHALEELYVEPPATPKKVRGQKKQGEIE